MRGFCATFATKSGKEKRATWSPERKDRKNRKDKKDRKDKNSCPSCRSCHPCHSYHPCPPVLSLPPCSRVSFLIPAPIRAHLKPSLSAFLQKNSARFSAFLQKIFCYLCIFNTRFSDHSCHPSHFFHCTHFTYLSHTYYYIRGRLLLLKKCNVKPMLNVIFAFWSKLPIIRELQKMAQKVPKFFAKKICRFQKSRYLCIRFQKITKAHEF